LASVPVSQGIDPWILPQPRLERLLCGDTTPHLLYRLAAVSSLRRQPQFRQRTHTKNRPAATSWLWPLLAVVAVSR